jgi:ribosomal protein S18 acetylase RimI-like enzyme
VSIQRTNDPVEARGWAFDLLGPGNPADFLLAPERFVFADRTEDSISLTLHGERWFGAGFGPNPPISAKWQTCVISSSTFGQRIGALEQRDVWQFYTRPIVESEEGPLLGEVSDAAAVTELLNRDAPHSRVWPGDPEIVAWYGVTDEEGLASVAALVRWESGHHVISSVATRADARGRGLAFQVVTGVVRAASRRHLAWLGLGVGDDNHVAQRLYERAGFTRRATFTMYRLPDRTARRARP